MSLITLMTAHITKNGPKRWNMQKWLSFPIIFHDYIWTDLQTFKSLATEKEKEVTILSFLVWF